MPHLWNQINIKMSLQKMDVYKEYGGGIKTIKSLWKHSLKGTGNSKKIRSKTSGAQPYYVPEL